MTNIITLTNITKVYQGIKTPAIQDVDLSIAEGEFFCLVGPSGCGKSTILKIIAGLEDPTKGSVSTAGATSMVFQSGALLPWLNVKDNIEFGMKMRKLPKTHIENQRKKYLTLVGLEEFEDKFPRELSGGQRQRVGLARALCMEEKILLLDEPFSALDPITTEELHTYLLAAWQQTGKTVVMVSHFIEEALLLADRIGVMQKGNITDLIKVDIKRPRRRTETLLKQADQIIRQLKNHEA